MKQNHRKFLAVFLIAIFLTNVLTGYGKPIQSREFVDALSDSGNSNADVKEDSIRTVESDNNALQRDILSIQNSGVESPVNAYKKVEDEYTEIWTVEDLQNINKIEFVCVSKAL